MAEPTKKSPEMENFLEREFGRTSAIMSDTCALCKKPAIEFRNEISIREYRISGLCQFCQDSIFGVD